MGKVSQGSRSGRGTNMRAVPWTVHPTLKKRSLEPFQVALDALHSFAATGQLPSLPKKIASKS